MRSAGRHDGQHPSLHKTTQQAPGHTVAWTACKSRRADRGSLRRRQGHAVTVSSSSRRTLHRQSGSIFTTVPQIPQFKRKHGVSAGDETSEFKKLMSPCQWRGCTADLRDSSCPAAKLRLSIHRRLARRTARLPMHSSRCPHPLSRIDDGIVDRAVRSA